MSKAIHIAKQRRRNEEEIEKQKRKLEEEKQSRKSFSLFSLKITFILVQVDIQSKFTTNVSKADEKLKAETVGLVTLDEMREKQAEIFKKGDDILIGKESNSTQEKPEKSKSVERTVEVCRVLVFFIKIGDLEAFLVVCRRRR
jgi:protein FAM50